MAYFATKLAQYIVNKCANDGLPISNLQLQKILYYIQREYLKKGQIAFHDDIEAWQFGPVVPIVYYDYCNFGSMPIIPFSNLDSSIDDIDKLKINPIVEEKRLLNPWDLVNDTHRPNGAWAIVYDNGNGNHKVIPTSLIARCG